MLNRESLGPFKVALAGALRTTDQLDVDLPGRFVEMTPGTIGTLRTDVNQLLSGRRGVGKSTTFAVLQQEAVNAGVLVIFVDVESHKLREYPDVLIEIILDVLAELRPSWWRMRPSVISVRRRVRRLAFVLTTLREAGPVTNTDTEISDEALSSHSINISRRAAKSFALLTATGGRSRSRSRRTSTKTSSEKRKEDYLRELTAALSATLTDAAGLSKSGSMLLVLDDFYMIEREKQPLVLDHLHGMTKRTPVWLKIASVRSRTQTFVNGDPPIGMQPPGDFHPMSLDVGLEKFPSAKAFLEEVAVGVLEPYGFDLDTVLTSTARERAVLVAGGAVCRDYFDTLIAAADVAWNEAQSKQPPTEDFRINAANIHAAAGELFDRKLTELRADAGLDAPTLEARFEDILRFVRDRETYFLLVRRDEIDLEWGREVVQLEDLRFVHRITSTRPNTGKFRGIDTVVFMVDIPALVKNRMTRAPIEFWKTGESDKLRRAAWVYSPGWSTTENSDGGDLPPADERAEEGQTRLNLNDI